nr:response regulator [Magnetococcales bacterium]
IDLELSLVSMVTRGELYFTGFLNDITDKRQFIASLRDTLKAAESANRAKSEFLANMSHEIRSPMNAIIGLTDLVLNTLLTPEEQRRNLEVVQQSSQALLEIINGILDMSKIEAGQFTLESVPFTVRDQVEGVCEALAVKAHQKGLELHCQLAGDVPKTVEGDPLRLRQILFNLLGNAIKFTTSGEVGIRAERMAWKGGGIREIHLLFSVTDTGIGIPLDKQVMVFDSFTQVDGSVSRRYGGTGLGLAISKHLVDLMGGKIRLESTPGQGSVFHFSVCFRMVEEDRTGEVIPTLAGLGVLAVWPSATGRACLQELLEANGARVRTLDGIETLAAVIRAEEPACNLLIVDHALLGDLISLLDTAPREGRPSPNSLWEDRVLILTPANLGSGNLHGLDRFQHHAFLKKPLRREPLLKAIDRLLGRLVEPATEPGPRAVLRREPHPLDILLVEDSDHSRQLASAVLEQVGHRVTVAERGEQVFELLQRRPCDLILMDLQMPGLGGLETTRRLRAMAPLAGGCHPATVPIIAVTARAQAEDRELCLAVGMNGYLSKPYRPRELLAAIAPVVQAHRDRILRNRLADPPRLRPPVASPEVQAGLRQAFLEQVPALRDVLRRALEQENRETLLRLVPELRGLARNVGAARLGAQLLKLRGKTEGEDWTETRAALQEVEEEFDRVWNALEGTSRDA